MILIENSQNYEKEVIFSVWPSGKVIKTEEDPVNKTGIVLIHVFVYAKSSNLIWLIYNLYKYSLYIIIYFF